MALTILGGTLAPVPHGRPPIDAVYGVDEDGVYLGIVPAAMAVGMADRAPPMSGMCRWIDGQWRQYKPPEQRKLEVEQQRDIKINAGVEWDGRQWYADTIFQQHLMGLLQAYTEGVVGEESTFPVRSRDKDVYMLKRDEIRALAGVVLAHVQEQFLWSWREKAKIDG